MRRHLVLALLCVWLPATADVTQNAWTEYAALPAKKALASATGPAGTATGSIGGQASDAAAAAAAFEACDARRRALALDAPCEVVRVNDTVVQSGAAIRARVPATRHPLFLWRYDGRSARVYLAGSMHVMKPTLLPLPVQYERAFAASDRLAVEVNTLAIPADRMQALLQKHGFLPPGQTLDQVLPEPARSTLRAHLADQGIPFAAVATLKPGLLATQLAVGRLAALGYLSQFGVDQQYIARAGERPVLELERVEDQIALLTSPPLELQVEMLAVTLEQMQTIEPLLADMVVAWLAGDDAALRRIFDAQSPQTEAFKAFEHALLDARNLRMADAIQGYLQTAGTYLVLVGAAHLAGDGSIVEVLTRRGVEGRRIHSDDTL